MTRPLSLPALARNRSGAFRMVALLASGALLGKILGFARELLMARVFGASLVADSFRGAGTAVMMPLIPMQNEGVPAVMIPMHRAWQEQGNAPEIRGPLCRAHRHRRSDRARHRGKRKLVGCLDLGPHGARGARHRARPSSG